MLRVLNKYNISGISGTPNYRIDAGNCVTYEEESFSNGILCVYFNYIDIDCYNENKKATIYILDDRGCETSYEVETCDPCESFSLVGDGIVNIADLKFKADVSLSKYMPYQYEWIYNRNQISLKYSKSNIAEFEYVSSDISVIELSVKITNTNGCCLIATKSFDICQPKGNDIVATTICNSGIVCSTIKIDIDMCDNSCGSDANINWPTLIIDTPKNVTYKHIGNGEVKFTFPSDFPKSLVSMTYTVCDIQNRKAYGNICINVVPCSGKPSVLEIIGELGCTDCGDNPPVLNSNLYAISGTIPEGYQECKGGSVKLNIENYISSNYPFDLSSFSFIAKEGDILISNYEISTQHGNAVYGLDRMVVYTPIDSIAVDTLKFKISDTSGSIAYGTISIHRKSSCTDTGSSAETFSDTVCVQAGECITFNPLDNDIGDIDPSSLDVQVPNPSAGTITKDNLGNVTFCPNAAFEGEVSLSYFVKDINGISSNISEIKYIVYKNSSSSTTEVSVCKSGSNLMSIYSMLGISNTSFRWRLLSGSAKIEVDGIERVYATNELIGTNHNPIIGLTNSPSGIYEFVYKSQYGNCGNSYIIRIDTVEDYKLPIDKSIQVCSSLAEFDIEQVAQLANGSWVNISPGGLGTIINPNLLSIGDYTWHYVVNNVGLFGEVCDSIFELTLSIVPVAYAGENSCIKVCSKHIEQSKDKCGSNEDAHVTCVISLFENLLAEPGKNITEGGYWTLTQAVSEKHNILFIDGIKHLISIGDRIPSNYMGNIDTGMLRSGRYCFVYSAGINDSSCYDEAELVLDVIQAPCAPNPITTYICDGHGNFNLWNALRSSYSGECMPISGGRYELIEGDSSPFLFQGNCNDLLDTKKVIFDIDQDQVKFKLRYIANISSLNSCQDCSECMACDQITEICIFVYKSNSSGIASNKSVVSGECNVNLFQLLSDFSYGGIWKYVGYGSTSSGHNALATNKISGYSQGSELDSSVISVLADTGFYYFSYKLSDEKGCCAETIVILQIVEAGNSGTSASIDVGEACIDLLPIIGGSPGGTWFNSNAPESSSPCTLASDESGYNQGKFNTTGVPTATYVFAYLHTTTLPEFDLLLTPCSGAAILTINKS